jgi:hypothetical protein
MGYLSGRKIWENIDAIEDMKTTFPPNLSSCLLINLLLFLQLMFLRRPENAMIGFFCTFWGEDIGNGITYMKY